MTKKKRKKPRSLLREKELFVESQRSGIVHRFDISAIQNLIEHYELQLSLEARTQGLKSATFWAWLNSPELPALSFTRLNVDMPLTAFRGIYGDYDPLTLEGNAAYGGRFNVGGAQAMPPNIFPHLQVGTCLYVADSAECAKAEATDPGLPNPHLKICELQRKKPLKLWRFENILSTLERPELQEILDSTIGANWKLQKFPRESQLLGMYLRGLGGDGISFPSTRYPKGRAFAIFAKSIDHCRQLFTYQNPG